MGVLVKLVGERGKPYFRQQASNTSVLTGRCDSWKGDRIPERSFRQIGALGQDQQADACRNLDTALGMGPDTGQRAQQGGFARARLTRQERRFARREVNRFDLQKPRTTRLCQVKSRGSKGGSTVLDDLQHSAGARRIGDAPFEAIQPLDDRLPLSKLWIRLDEER